MPTPTPTPTPKPLPRPTPPPRRMTPKPTPSPTPRPPAAPATPSLADGMDFFPKAIATAAFQSKGVVFGTDSTRRNLHWAVIDPRKHRLRLWQKRQPDYVQAAVAQRATLVTNGPFIKYGGSKNSVSAIDKIAVWALGAVSPFDVLLGTHASNKITRQQIMKMFQQSTPVGSIQGSRVTNLHIPVANACYFGRSGNKFGDYVIARGDTKGEAEAMGGLAESVYNYVPQKAPPSSNTFCHWGLVPLTGKDSRILQQASNQKAIAEYAKQETTAGVIFCVAYSGHCLDSTLPTLGVRHAVRLDGSDSVVFGAGAKLHWGNSMVEYKRVAHQWGLVCYSY